MSNCAGTICYKKELDWLKLSVTIGKPIAKGLPSVEFEYHFNMPQPAVAIVAAVL